MNPTDHIRRCEVCDHENPPDAVRCECGALLAHIDLTPRRPALIATQAQDKLAGPLCPHPDCAMPNPPGSVDCLYCARPLESQGATASETPALPAASQTTPLPAGLAGNWQVVRAFPASGGEADLYLVSGERGQAVAKLYRHGLAPAAAVLDRLKDIAGRPVVHLIDHGSNDGRAWELLEYCPLGNLRDWLVAGPRPRDDIIALVRELSGALEALQAAGILHRDLKPENVLLRSNTPLELALTDFGTARLQSATQHFTEAARTTLYAAPETLAGVLDAASDWWSVGMIVLEAASGRHPFAGLSDLVIAHHLATRPVRIEGIADDSLAALCAGLLLRNPQKRWQAAELRRWLAGDRSLGHPGESGDSTTLRPYRIGDAECRTPAELAAALASHWPEASRDLARGNIRKWLDNEWHDHNLLRHFDDRMALRDQSDDRRLLDTLLLLDHRLPPVWQGQPASREAILAAASRADTDTEARAWLLTLYREDVLLALRPHAPSLADAGLALADAVRELHDGWQTVEDLLKTRRRHQRQISGEDASYVDMDSAIYGPSSVQHRPDAEILLPRLFTAVLDPASLAGLRHDDDLITARLLPDCPWLAHLPTITENAPGPLLIRHFALPLAEQDAKRSRQEKEVQQRRRQRELRQMNDTYSGELHSLLAAVEHGDPEGARAALDTLSNISTIALALSEPLQEAEQLRLRAERTRPTLHLIRRTLDQFDYQTRRRDIWLQPLRLLIGVAIVYLLGSSIHLTAGLGAGAVMIFWWLLLKKNADRAAATLRRVAQPLAAMVD